MTYRDSTFEKINCGPCVKKGVERGKSDSRSPEGRREMAAAWARDRAVERPSSGVDVQPVLCSELANSSINILSALTHSQRFKLFLSVETFRNGQVTTYTFTILSQIILSLKYS